MTTVLINGIDTVLGSRIAALLDDGTTQIIGLSRTSPTTTNGRVQLLRAPLDGDQLVELLRTEAVDAVLQLAFLGADGPAPDRETTVQQNLLETMELLGACVRAGVPRVVVRSDTGVYGASALNPAFMPETWPIARDLRGLLRDFAEVEEFLDELAHAHPELCIVRLRCAPLLGIASPLARYLDQPQPLMIAGFNPVLQLLHVDDAATAFVRATQTPARGAYNLAAEDTVTLAQLIRLGGRQPLPVLEPFLAVGLAVGGLSLVHSWPFELGFLRHSCIAATERARHELGWAPTVRAREVIVAQRDAGTPSATVERPSHKEVT